MQEKQQAFASLTDGCLGAAHGYSAAARRTSFPRIGLTAAQLAGLGGRLKAQKRALRASSCNKACAIDEIGGVAEWLKAHAWKACIRETVSRVRIPLPPPDLLSKGWFLRRNCPSSSGPYHNPSHIRFGRRIRFIGLRINRFGVPSSPVPRSSGF